ncbi:hypothetical protein Hanom_Chr05g00386351 [Helianthus anomalus]
MVVVWNDVTCKDLMSVSRRLCVDVCVYKLFFSQRPFIKKTSARPLFGADVGSPLLTSNNLCPNIKTRFFLLIPKSYHLSTPSPHQPPPSHCRILSHFRTTSHQLPSSSTAAIVNNQQFGASLLYFGVSLLNFGVSLLDLLMLLSIDAH